MIKQIILFVIILIAGCGQKKHYPLDDLKKEKWNRLADGVDYISIQDEKGIGLKSDSVEISLKGVIGNDFGPVETSFDRIDPEMNNTVSAILKYNLTNSKAGFLRINLVKMVNVPAPNARIYLKGDYAEPFSFRKDSTFLKNLRGIQSVTFISKEEGKRIFLSEEGNSDWEKVLSANPLLNAIEIKLDERERTIKSMQDLKDSILSHMTMAADIQTTDVSTKKSDYNYFFEYKRK